MRLSVQSSDRDEILATAINEGWPTSRIAVELGVTRQRAHQLLSEDGARFCAWKKRRIFMAQKKAMDSAMNHWKTPYLFAIARYFAVRGKFFMWRFAGGRQRKRGEGKTGSMRLCLYVEGKKVYLSRPRILWHRMYWRMRVDKSRRRIVRGMIVGDKILLYQAPFQCSIIYVRADNLKPIGADKPFAVVDCVVGKGDKSAAAKVSPMPDFAS